MSLAHMQIQAVLDENRGHTTKEKPCFAGMKIGWF